MRISRVSLAGLVALFGASAAKEAAADDLTVTTAQTNPVTTAAANNGTAGSVTVNSGGSILVGAGQAAVTMNDPGRNVTVNAGGIVGSNDANNTNGIQLNNGFSGNVAINGAVNLLENFTLADTDNDGDLDGEYAAGTNRNGIFLQPGAFTGDITIGTTGSINLEGNNSAGIRLDGRLTGNLSSAGVLSIVGDDTNGIALNGGAAGGVTGNVTINGVMAVRGENTTGLLVGAPIGGALNIAAQITSTGYHSTSRPLTAAAAALLDADDLLLSGSAVNVQAGVAGGITFRGTGVEDDTDDDGDGITEAAGDADDDASAAITTFSSAPAVLIRPNATTPLNIVIGPTASGFGIVNRGAINSTGIFDNIDSAGVRIEGVGAATVTTANGLRNDGSITTTAFEANATGVYIGAGASVPTIENRKSVDVRVTSEANDIAASFWFAPNATVNTFVNTGTIQTQLFGETGSTYGIRDQSGTLTSITNSGTIVSQLIVTDGDLTDNITPPITGPSVAIDVSANTTGVTFNQIADAAFTDDDSTDDDIGSRPLVQTVGSIFFGSGADTVNLLAGTIVGNMSMGAGLDTFIINNGASYAGRLSDADGQLNIDVINGDLGLAGGAVNITTGRFRADSNLAVLLATNPLDSTVITATGNVTFDPGAVITPVIPVGLPTSGTHVFLTAGSLTGASNVTRVVTGAGSPFIYNLAIEVAPGNPNSLQAAYLLKSTTQLGLDNNEATAFNPIITALRTDDIASIAFANLQTEAEFRDAYEDLLPNYSAAAAELAATAIQQMQSATTNRLAAARVRDNHEVSAWAQEIGYGLNRDPQTFGLAYRGYGFGFAAGIDGPLNNGALFGLSMSFIASEVTEPGRADGELATSLGQANAYLGTSMGAIDLDFVAGFGGGKINSRRFVEIGSFEAIPEADWWTYEGHGAIRASMPLSMGSWLVATPYGALTYVFMNEQGYDETGGGTAIDLSVDSTTSQRLWADAGIEFAARFGRSGQTMVQPHIMLGYRANVLDEAAERTLRFSSGGPAFTLIDETTGSGGPLLGLGIDATNGFSTFTLRYEGEFGDELQRHSLNAAIRFRF